MAVAYTHSFAYLSDRDSGKLFSGLRLAISSPEKRVRTVDTVAQLDTGSDFYIFDGQLWLALSESISWTVLRSSWHPAEAFR